MDACRAVLKLSCVLCLWFGTLNTYANEHIVLQLRWTHQAQFIGYYIAKQKGFYTAAGFDVEIRPGKPGLIPWQEVISGDADFAVDNSSAFTAFSEGQPLVALASILQQSPSVFLSLKSSNIEQPSDFRQRRVTLHPDAQDPELMALLKQQRVSPNELQPVPTSNNIQDLIQGRIDVYKAYLTNEPYHLQLEGVEYNVINPRNYGINFYGDLLLTHTDRVLKQTNQVNRFRKASLQGWRYALQHPEEALNVMEQHYTVAKSRGHSRYELNMLREMIMPDIVEVGHMTEERWQKIEHELRKLELITAPKVDLGRFLFSAPQLLENRSWFPWLSIASGVLVVVLICATLLVRMYRRLKVETRKRKQAEQKLHHLSTHDPLTQLPNRNALIEQLTILLKLAHRHHTTPALFYIDLDGFKGINDSLGHKCGDELLIKFSNRIRKTLRESDIFGRLDSDEFLLIVDESTEEGSSHLAMKMMEQLNKPFLIDDQDIKLSASIGIARYTDCGENADELIRRADKAMYKVKNSFKAGFSLARPPTIS